MELCWPGDFDDVLSPFDGFRTGIDPWVVVFLGGGGLWGDSRVVYLVHSTCSSLPSVVLLRRTLGGLCGCTSDWNATNFVLFPSSILDAAVAEADVVAVLSPDRRCLFVGELSSTL